MRYHTNLKPTTTIAEDLDSTETVVTVTSDADFATAFPTLPYAILVDDEAMLVTSKGGAGNVDWTVTRDYDGTAAATHSNGAAVTAVVVASDISSSRIAYTPAWTATGTAPAIGNGVIEGDYSVQGNVVSVRMAMRAGSTSTYGTGSYRWSVPVPFITALTSEQVVGHGFVVDEGARYWGGLTALMVTSTTFEFAHGAASIGVVTQTSPFTWAAAGDRMGALLTYPWR